MKLGNLRPKFYLNIARGLAIFLFCVTTSATEERISLRKRSAVQCDCNPSLSCDPKYQKVPGHTACLSRAATAVVPNALTQAEKDDIVAHHNRLRGLVDPVATNMLKMFWDDEVAMLAQKWAEACDLGSSNSLHHDKERNIPGRYSVGQNIGTGYISFSEVIDDWFAEKDNYKPLFGTSVRNVAGSKPIGHYTQLVWATTNRVGCGFAECNGLAFHVCNYAPMGNMVPFDSPYKTGPQKCSDCKKCDAGLCDCGDLTCENYGKLNVTTCSCACKYTDYQIGPRCQLSCNYEKDLYFCGTQRSFHKTDCGIPYTSSACPKLCEVCPCAETTLSACKGSSTGQGGGSSTGQGGGSSPGKPGKDKDSGASPVWNAQLLFLMSISMFAQLPFSI